MLEAYVEHKADMLQSQVGRDKRGEAAGRLGRF